MSDMYIYKVLWISEMADMYIQGVVDVKHVHTRCGGCETCTNKVWWMSDMYIDKVWWLSLIHI